MKEVPLLLKMAHRRALAELEHLETAPLDSEDDGWLGESVSREEMRAKRISLAKKALKAVDLEIETSRPHDVCTLEPTNRCQREVD